MKKLFLLLTAGVFLSLQACKESSGGLSATAKKNIAASDAIANCFKTKDFSKIGDYIAEDCVDHGGENGDIKGLENMKAEFTRMAASYSEMSSEKIKELADDEYVMSWMKYTGKLSKDMMGKKAGETFVSTSMEVSRFKDGKAVEHWVFMEPSEMMKMMQGQQPPAMDEKPMADSTKAQ